MCACVSVYIIKIIIIAIIIIFIIIVSIIITNGIYIANFCTQRFTTFYQISVE